MSYRASVLVTVSLVLLNVSLLQAQNEKNIEPGAEEAAQATRVRKGNEPQGESSQASSIPPPKEASSADVPAADSSQLSPNTNLAPTAPTTTPFSAAVAWEAALLQYELGNSEKALIILQQAVETCDSDKMLCTPQELGSLYACVGIVLSGGEGRHTAGVQAFKKALALEPTIVIYPVYQIAPVTAAFNEAQGPNGSAAQTAAPSSKIPASNKQDEYALEKAAEQKAHEEDLLKKRGILLASANVQFGNINMHWNDNWGSLDDNGWNISDGLARLGGSATLGAMPFGTSGFTVGVRGRAGAYFVQRTTGHWGGAVVLGSTIGRRQEQTFTYFLGGLGFDYLPTFDTAAPSLSFQGGVSMHGFLLGGTMDISAGNDFHAVLFGIESGFGGLL